MASNERFVFSPSAPRVVFGPGSINSLPEELRRLGVKLPIIVCSPTRASLARTVNIILETASLATAGIVDKAVVHVPINITESSMASIEANGADCVISVGGGSAVGLGKAICFRTGLPHICIPTTYSGSEMTAILGELKDGKKVAVTDPKILPSTVIYDVDLTMQLPKHLSAVSGLNAMAHSVEALYARDANPVTSLVALESLKCLAESLPRVAADPLSREARSSVLYGAFLAGMAVASTGIALQHKLAHTVAGCCNLPHAETHAILLPHTVAYNLPSLGADVIERFGMALVGRPGLSAQDIVSAITSILQSLEIECALKDIGMNEDDIDRTVHLALEKQYWNPRPLEKEKIKELIRRAWAGETARADL
ncbi:iron-containing alcohol dehydrogenase [Coniochaeta ligniaria NRRL 30616]|uniref:Iron-containing alcohol dehydrogenase n=1 Tax=Coniochaeta ligniaria NRRL 30616 TaxID=1408157 RepID=A0A1J7JFV3_9PEZI|nr:iron-containing alcohol dehydrogenase [Coniochaeta ligniaria NRRL 30616]